MLMLAAVTCLARRRRMHCRGSDPAAAVLELDQRHCGPCDQRHRWQTEPAPSALHAFSGSSPHDRRRRGGALVSSGRQGRRRLSQEEDGGPALQDTRRRRQAVPGPGSLAAAMLKKAPAAGDDAHAAAENAGAPPPSSSEAASPMLCAVCLEDVRGQGAAAATLACSHSYHPGCVLPWLAEHGACPCRRDTVPWPED